MVFPGVKEIRHLMNLLGKQKNSQTNEGKAELDHSKVNLDMGNRFRSETVFLDLESL